MYKLLRKSQKRHIPKIVGAGDTVYVCIFVHTDEEREVRCIITDYAAYLKLNEKQVDERAVPFSLSNQKTREYVLKELGLGD
jgi:hypothetical protein